VALLLAVGLLYGLGLGARDLWAPDEPRYGAIAEELRSFRHGTSGLALLHLNDAPYTQKPPLYFWLAALAGLPFGRVDELAARLPSALAGVGCVGLTAWLGRWLLGHAGASLLAAGLLATSFRFAWSARRVQLDVLLTFFELLAIALFLWLELRRGGIERARMHPAALAGLHGALGAAALVKGPVGWLPLLVFAGYLAWEGRLRAFRSLVPPWAWLLSVAPVAVWITTAVALAPAGFADRAVGENLIGRFFEGTSHARPFYYYAYQLPIDFLPWSLLLPFALPVVWHWARSRPPTSSPEIPSTRPAPLAPSRRMAARFLLAWIGLPLVFFTLSAGKRGLYLLPVFPALALVAAAVVVEGAARPEWSWKGLPLAPLARILVVVALLESAIFLGVLPRLHAEKSPRPIAEAAAAGLEPSQAIGVYALRPLEGGITYYSGRSVVSLQTPDQLDRFLEAGGQRVILRTRHLEAPPMDRKLGEIARLRSGHRSIAVAGPAARPTPRPSATGDRRTP
jgi:4-amino-4-deoxy-L-arabinose transferase-like glycosyltransferase